MRAVGTEQRASWDQREVGRGQTRDARSERRNRTYEQRSTGHEERFVRT